MCLALKVNDFKNYRWGDEDCSILAPYICQFEEAYCGGQARVGNMCYQMYGNEMLNWYDARLACESLPGGSLITIEDKALNDALKSQAETLDGNNLRIWWVGASRNTWTYSDATTFCDDMELEVTGRVIHINSPPLGLLSAAVASPLEMICKCNVDRPSASNNAVQMCVYARQLPNKLNTSLHITYENATPIYEYTFDRSNMGVYYYKECIKTEANIYRHTVVFQGTGLTSPYLLDLRIPGSRIKITAKCFKNSATRPSTASSSSNVGMIAGIVVGLLLLLALVACVGALLFFRRRRKRRPHAVLGSAKPSAPLNSNGDTGTRDKFHKRRLPDPVPDVTQVGPPCGGDGKLDVTGTGEPVVTYAQVKPKKKPPVAYNNALISDDTATKSISSTEVADKHLDVVENELYAQL